MKVTDHGSEFTYYFCADCGTTVFGTGGSERVKGMISLRPPVLDQTEELEKIPMVEIYVDRRYSN